MGEGLLRRALRIAVGVATALASVPVPATPAESWTIHLTWTELQHELRPKPGPKWLNSRVSLSQHEDHSFSDGIAAGPPRFMKTYAGEFVLGADGRGKVRNVEWTRIDDDTFVRVLTRPSYVQTIRIERKGESCAASVRYALRPGQSAFVVRRVSNNETMFIGRIDVKRVTCRVGEYQTS